MKIAVMMLSAALTGCGSHPKPDAKKGIVQDCSGCRLPESSNTMPDKIMESEPPYVMQSFRLPAAAQGSPQFVVEIWQTSGWDCKQVNSDEDGLQLLTIYCDKTPANAPKEKP